VKETVPFEQAVTKIEHPLSPRVQEALGELVGVAQEGLLALSVGLGLGVLADLMAEEVTEVVGPKGHHDRARAAGCPSSARGCGPQTARARSGSRSTATSPTAIR